MRASADLVSLRARIVVAMAVVLIGLAITGCGSTQGTSAGSAPHQEPASSSSLDDVILAASQVGPGYRGRVIQDGRRVQGQVTLDLCGFAFASEALRIARLQVAYYQSGRAPALSNEVVSYKPGGTGAAMQELREAVQKCPRKPVVGPVAGEPPTTYRLTRIKVPGVVHGSLALAVRETALIGGKHKPQTEIVIYQTKRSTLSAVYAAGARVAASTALALQAAQQSARNLSHG
jgi:hypothetical protein